MEPNSIEEDLKILDVRMKQLKLAYEQYFLGTRPREPQMMRREVEKTIVFYSNTPIQNTGMRFKFNSLTARYNAFKRQWNDILRKIEAGTYERHVFKANLREQVVAEPRAKTPPSGAAADSTDLYEAYVEARQACGQDVANLSREKVSAALERQASAIRQKHGGDVEFRVVVEQGKAKLKAKRVSG